MSHANSDHYKKYHRNFPHEHALNIPNPKDLERKTVPYSAAYAGLYVALGFASLILILVIVGMYWDYRRKQKRETSDRKKVEELPEKIYPTVPEMNEGNPIRSSLTTTEVQPKQNLPLYYPTAPKKGLNFGAYNVQPEGLNSKNDLRDTESNLSYHEVPMKRTPSKMDSFPYEDFNLDVTERTPLHDYLRLTPEIARMDSLQEFGDEKGFDRNAPTMPRKDSLKPGTESQL